MSYDEKKNSLSRTPVELLVLYLDTCGLTFGQGLCYATGEPCVNTFPKCKAQDVFDRQVKAYEFCSVNAPLPFPGPRPYLDIVSYTPTEIKDTLAVKGRVSIDLRDEPEPTDIGLDPYVSQRATIYPGTYFKKLLARNPNHEGRPAEIYQGFYGDPREEFKLKWRGEIETITTGTGKATVKLVDPLAGIEDIQIPPEIEVETVTEVTADHTAITLTGIDTDMLPDSGAIRIDDEFIQYGAINRATNVISDLTRGAFGSTAAEHGAGNAVSLMLYIGPANPFDLLQAFLTASTNPREASIPGAGMPVERIDTAAFEYWKNWPEPEPDFEALIEEPTDLETLIFEVLDIVDASIWYSEGQQITIRRNIPNEPGRVLRDLNDPANIVLHSGQTETPRTAYTRVGIFWERRPMQDPEKRRSYRKADTAIDADAEGPNGRNKVVEKGISGRFLSAASQQTEVVQNYAVATVSRRLIRVKDANPVLRLLVELKDVDILTGDQVAITTDEIIEPSGEQIIRGWGIVTKRNPRGNVIELTIEIYRGPRFAFIAPDDAPDYDDATIEEQDYCYISDDLGRIDDAPGYAIY